METVKRINNSLLPLGAPSANVVNTLRMNVNKLNNQVNNVLNSFAGQSVVPVNYLIPLSIFASFVVLFLVLMYFFNNQIKDGYNSLINNIRILLGYNSNPPSVEEEEITKTPTAPQDESESNRQISQPLVEKILPNNNTQVFNVSKNSFTYYDAEPLCKALGAELATYDQVKTAWEKGADWCNYGWVKGQAAVYPTQKSTWDKLQGGPEEQRGSCGVPGLNGGHFDNPELQFGVNCYGPKPEQSEHDQEKLMKGMARSPSTIEFDNKVAKFRTEAASLGIMPFNEDKWSTF